MRYLAYKVAYLSTTKIEKEACKAEPRLRKLVGHAALFDQTREFIVGQAGDENEGEADELEDLVEDSDEEDEKDQEDDVPYCQYIERAEDIEHIDDVEHPLNLNEPAEPKLSNRFPSQRNENTKRLLVLGVIRTEVKEVQTDDWENNSDSSTEAGDNDQDSDGEWSNSTCEGDDEDDAHSNCKIIDVELGFTVSKYVQNSGR